MEFNELVEKSAHITANYKVTPEIYHSFQRCSNDYNPLHTDTAFAMRHGFPKCVMYGNILNAFLSHFVGMLLPTRKVIIQSQDISFHRPVFLNDELELTAEPESVSEAVRSVVYKVAFRKIVGWGKSALIAKGHVQIGLLNERNV